MSGGTKLRGPALGAGVEGGCSTGMGKAADGKHALDSAHVRRTTYLPRAG